MKEVEQKNRMTGLKKQGGVERTHVVLVIVLRYIHHAVRLFWNFLWLEGSLPGDRGHLSVALGVFLRIPLSTRHERTKRAFTKDWMMVP